MAQIYSDGDYSQERFIGPAIIEYPLPRESGAFLVRQRVSVDANDYVAANVAGNTGQLTHPVYQAAMLVAEIDFEHLHGGIFHFTKIYANVPASHTTPGGTASYTFPGWVNQRDPVTYESQVLREHDFFVTTDWRDIAETPRFRPVNNNGWDVEILNDGGGVLIPTIPSRSNYQAGNVGGATGAKLINGDLYVAIRTGTIDRYFGNIWQRTTDWVKAI